MDKIVFDELVVELSRYIENNYQQHWSRSIGSVGFFQFKYGKFVVEVFSCGTIYIDDIAIGYNHQLHSKLLDKLVAFYDNKRKEDLNKINKKLKLSKISTPEKVRYYWDKVINWLNTYRRKR